MFNYDWFHGLPFKEQLSDARWRCTVLRHPDVTRETLEQNKEAHQFHGELVCRTLVYLRDGFSYEVREFADVPYKSHLVFECVPVDDQYRVGAFVVTVPFDEIVRVEVFSVHPDEKPDDLPQITGFRGSPEPEAKPTPKKPSR